MLGFLLFVLIVDCVIDIVFLVLFVCVFILLLVVDCLYFEWVLIVLVLLVWFIFTWFVICLLCCLNVGVWLLLFCVACLCLCRVWLILWFVCLLFVLYWGWVFSRADVFVACLFVYGSLLCLWTLDLLGLFVDFVVCWVCLGLLDFCVCNSVVCALFDMFGFVN